MFWLYKTLNAILPIGLLLLIRVGLVELAVLLALFSKWRVFAVKPRHLLTNLRANSVDIIVKLSTLAYMIEAETFAEQIVWTAWYVLWLTVIKPASQRGLVMFQAATAQVLGLSAILLFSNSINDLFIHLGIWVIAYSSARHFLSVYEEPKGQLISHLWALFVLQLSWVLSKWLLVYVMVPQLIFILAVIGYALASVYDAEKREQLKASFVRQQTIMTIAVLILIIFIADWQGNS